MRTHQEIKEAYLRQGRTKEEAHRLATMEKLREAIKRDAERIAEIDKIIEDLDPRDPRDARNVARLKVQRSLIEQFTNEDKAQLADLKERRA